MTVIPANAYNNTGNVSSTEGQCMQYNYLAKHTISCRLIIYIYYMYTSTANNARQIIVVHARLLQTVVIIDRQAPM